MEVFSHLINKTVSGGFLTGYTLKRRNGEAVTLSHLLFADDRGFRIFGYYVFPTKKRDLFLYFEKPFLKKQFRVTTYFCFILKEKTK